MRTEFKEHLGYRYKLERMTDANFFGEINYPGELTVTFGCLNWFRSNEKCYALMDRKCKRAIEQHVNAHKS